MTQTIAPTRNLKAARFYGGFFILTFLAYGIGSGIVDTALAGGSPLADLAVSSTLYISGVGLMTILHTIANMILATIMFCILAPYARFLSAGYFGGAIIATTALLVGGVFLSLVVPLSGVADVDPEQAALWVMLLSKANFYAYQIGMTLWGTAGILMCIVLFRTRLVPRLFSIWGLIGYTIFIIGTVSELYGSGIGVMLSLPGGLFEIGMSIWLIIKGFDYQHVGDTE
ncbi:DUF4386 domain-containing protein [Maritalea sp.]|uniref:DUF4386 domain-containing protein n=1 Tax=Maritalea sp. TaxID=2003361 RepID=UPI003EF48C2E